MLSNKLELNLGYLYENVVSQMLIACGRKLYYHTWPREGSTHNYEVDFLIIKNGKVCPIEVKSGSIKSHDSIDVFSKKYSNIVGAKYLISTKDVGKDKDLLLKPLYLFERILLS